MCTLPTYAIPFFFLQEALYRPGWIRVTEDYICAVYNFPFFESLRGFFVSYIACKYYPYIQSLPRNSIMHARNATILSHDFATKYKKHHSFMINCNIPGEKSVCDSTEYALEWNIAMHQHILISRNVTHNIISYHSDP